MNNSELNKNISLLVDTSYTCDIDILRTLIFAISAVINILHFPVIYRVKKLNNNANTRLLLVISVNDIGLAALRLAGIVCLYDWLETTHPCEFTFLHSLWEITALMRYVTLAIACYNRYVAIYRPFQYSGNRVLDNAMLSMLGAFLVALIINTPLHAFQKCYQTFYQESLELVRFVIHSMWVNIYLIIIVITIILVLRELRKLRVRSIGDHPEIYFLTTCF